MAIYFVRMSKVSRKAKPQGGQRAATVLARGQSGRSAVAAAAYAAGVRLTDERLGTVYDYRAKDGVYQSFIVGAGGWTDSPRREDLWNMAERSERRSDACTAREWVIALPHELTHDQRASLTRQIAEDLASRFGVIVDASIHIPNREGDQRNFHAHLLMTTKRVRPDGSLGEKTRELDDFRGKQILYEVRAQMAERMNAALAAGGHAGRVDHRTNEAQGIERPAQLHEGVAATNARRRNFRTTPEERGEKTWHQRNQEAGAIVPFAKAEQLRVVRDQLAANAAELSQLQVRRIKLPRQSRAAQQRAGGKDLKSEERFIWRIFAALVEMLGDFFNSRQLAQLAAVAAVQHATDSQKTSAIRASSRALRAKEKRLIASMAGKSEGKGATEGQPVRKRRRRVYASETAVKAETGRANAERKAAIKRNRPPQTYGGQRTRPQKARYQRPRVTVVGNPSKTDL